MKSTILLLILVTISQAPLTGKVVRVLDGDTIEVLVNNTPVRVRLDGIDCPEKRQDFGQKAKEFTSAMSFAKTVKVIDSGKDRYGRTLGVVVLPDGKILNELLVKEGFAWHYKRYSSDKKLDSLQSSAQKSKKGLWQNPSPTPPWDFRRKAAAVEK